MEILELLNIDLVVVFQKGFKVYNSIEFDDNLYIIDMEILELLNVDLLNLINVGVNKSLGKEVMCISFF